MKTTISNRIVSLDLLRGLVIVIMALDHARSFFHFGYFFGKPEDIDTTTPLLFFTRFITHFCAPVFVFLAGTSAFLYGRKKGVQPLFKFLIARGFWLILIEIIVVGFGWNFDLSYSLHFLQVIWVLGISMAFLAFMLYLPKKLMLIIGLAMVFGHNLMDGIQEDGSNISAIAWYLLHQKKFLMIGDGFALFFFYPLIPWLGVMVLGYVFGNLYLPSFPSKKRCLWLLIMGNAAIVLFLFLRSTNLYGDPSPWELYPTEMQSFLSFFKVTKYPVSLLFLLITLGPSMLVLFLLDKVNVSQHNLLLIFGRVPFFFYVTHIYLLHIMAIVLLIATGGNGNDLILTAASISKTDFTTYGHPLYVVYTVWVLAVAMLYPICKIHLQFKRSNRDKWWISYL